MAGAETTLSEKVSCVLSSTTLRQVLKRETVSRVSIQQVRRSSVAVSLSGGWLKLVCRIVGVDALRTCCSEKSLIENYLHTRIRCTQLFQNPTAAVSNFLNGEESHKRTGHQSHATPRSPPRSVRNPESIRTIWGLGGLLEGPLAPFCVQKETSPHWPVALRSRPSARIRESSSPLGLDRKREKLHPGTISQSPPESQSPVHKCPAFLPAISST